MARHQKSGFISAAGTIFEIVKAIADEVYALGGSDDDLRRILTEHGLRKQIAKLLITKLPGPIFSVDVQGSISDLIRQGNYGWSDNAINDQHFTADASHTADIILKHFGHNMRSGAVLKALDAEGLRPATISELLALGIKYPDLQREFPIIALGSVWQDSDGDRRVGYLSYNGGQRWLHLNWLDCGWCGSCRFAAVRK